MFTKGFKICSGLRFPFFKPQLVCDRDFDVVVVGNGRVSTTSRRLE